MRESGIGCFPIVAAIIEIIENCAGGRNLLRSAYFTGFPVRQLKTARPQQTPPPPPHRPISAGSASCFASNIPLSGILKFAPLSPTPLELGPQRFPLSITLPHHVTICFSEGEKESPPHLGKSSNTKSSIPFQCVTKTTKVSAMRTSRLQCEICITDHQSH